MGTTTARGRSLLGALYAGRKTFEPGSCVTSSLQPCPHFLEFRNVSVYRQRPFVFQALKAQRSQRTSANAIQSAHAKKKSR